MNTTATASLAINTIAKSLDQAIASLDELEAQIVGLNDDDATRIALDLIAQRDRLDGVYDKFAQLAERLSECEEPEPPDDPLGQKDPWETDFPQNTAYLYKLDFDDE